MSMVRSIELHMTVVRGGRVMETWKGAFRSGSHRFEVPSTWKVYLSCFSGRRVALARPSPVTNHTLGIDSYTSTTKRLSHHRRDDQRSYFSGRSSRAIYWTLCCYRRCRYVPFFLYPCLQTDFTSDFAHTD